MPNTPPHIVQVTTTSYSRAGVIGGGERLALYIDESLRVAAERANIRITTTLLALDGLTPIGGAKDRHQALVGRPWDVHSLDADELTARLWPADVVYVHQCMTHVGLFVAAHARLLGKRVFGSDSGAGEAPIIAANSNAMTVYDGLHAQSVFAASSFEGLPVPVHIIPGPVDTELHRPPAGDAPPRDPTLVVSVGRILPHKGHERVIRALPLGMALIVVGQHYDLTYLSYLRACAAGKNVSFADGLDDTEVRALLRRAGTFVHASTHIDYRGNYAHKPELLGLAPLEALASGLPTLVSDAASLPELAVVPGCRVFRDEHELSAMLHEAARGSVPTISAADMHDDVTSRYGLVAVGSRLLDVMQVGSPCAF